MLAVSKCLEILTGQSTGLQGRRSRVQPFDRIQILGFTYPLLKATTEESKKLLWGITMPE
jgi:hypothetical protein